MTKRKWTALAVAVVLATPTAFATNGDNLIGVGPSSRAMGGTGVAAPQDSITAIFANPAAMGVCPCGDQSESVFGATLFDPGVDLAITTPMGTQRAESQHDVFIIPAIGVTMPLNDEWRFGVGAFGISGLGVDYRNRGIELDGDPATVGDGDLYTRLEIMKFAPMISYKASDTLSLGGAVQVAYNNLDLGSGGTHDYSFGAQVGAVSSLGMAQVGVTYSLPMKASFDRVFNFDEPLGSTSLDTLDLEAPGQTTVGIAVEPMKKLLLAGETRFVQWGDADGYKDFDWDDQWVFAVGAQYQATDKIALRCGYNYGENPVKEHNGFDPRGISNIQGTSTPTFGYELFRTIGFPAIVEHHLTLGLGYQIRENLSMNLEYMHAFEKDFSETSAGGFVDLESTLEEDSLGFSLAWAFE